MERQKRSTPRETTLHYIEKKYNECEEREKISGCSRSYLWRDWLEEFKKLMENEDLTQQLLSENKQRKEQLSHTTFSEDDRKKLFDRAMNNSYTKQWFVRSQPDAYYMSQALMMGICMALQTIGAISEDDKQRLYTAFTNYLRKLDQDGMYKAVSSLRTRRSSGQDMPEGSTGNS